MDVLLPFGLTTSQGDRYRNVRIGPLNGHGELECAGESNPIRAVVGLLLTSLERLGPYQQAELTPGLLGQLLPVDLSFLAVQLIRETFGDVQFLTVACPREDCSSKLDLRPDLSDVEADFLPESLVAETVIPSGLTVRFRLPQSSDQLQLYDESDGIRNRSIVDICLLEEDGFATREQVHALSEETIERLAATLLSRSPELDLAAELSCVECDRPFKFVYDPGQQILASLRASRTQIMREVHYLAYHYHWSHKEILGLSRPVRREFLALLQEELDGEGALQ